MKIITFDKHLINLLNLYTLLSHFILMFAGNSEELRQHSSSEERKGDDNDFSCEAVEISAVSSAMKIIIIIKCSSSDIKYTINSVNSTI